MPDAAALRQIKSRYRALGSLMDERMRRQWPPIEGPSRGRPSPGFTRSASADAPIADLCKSPLRVRSNRFMISSF